MRQVGPGVQHKTPGKYAADQPGDQIHDDCGVFGDGDTSGDTWPLCVPTNRNRANSGDFEAEGWRMAVVLKTNCMIRDNRRVTNARAWSSGIVEIRPEFACFGPFWSPSCH